MNIEILNAIFKASPVGMILLDENTNVLTANSAVSAIVLKEPEEIIGQRGGGALNCIYSFENDKGCGFSQACPDCPLRKQILAVLASGTPVHGFEIQPTLRLNGRDHQTWLRISAEPIVLNGRKHVLVAIDDITDRKQIEEELNNERKFLKTILDAIGAPVFYKDMQGLYLGCNEAFCRFIGLPRDEIVGKTVFDVAPHPLAEIYHHADQEMYQSKTDQKYETCVRNTEGDPRHVVFHKTPFRNADGEMIGIVGVILDITERKHAEEELNRNQAVLNGIIESSGLPIYAIDTNYCYILFNECHANTMKLLYGVDIEIGANILEYDIPKTEYDSGKKGFDKALSGRYVHDQLCTGGVEKRYFDIFYSPIQINQGNIIGVSVFLTDTTQRIVLEQQTDAFYQKLSHASKLTTLGEIASSIAHEINQPLCSIVTYAEACLQMMSSKTFNHDKVCEIMEIIVKQSQHAGEICNHIKNFMRKTPPNLTEVNINAVIQDTLALMHKQINENRCKVKLDLDMSLPLLFLDVVQIEQVLVNLIMNALDATFSESRKSLIVVSTSFRSKKEIEIKFCDNGKGLKNINEKELFNRFFTTKENGLGLGLPISKSIIESYGGRIYIVSNPDGIGATVGIIFPARN